MIEAVQILEEPQSVFGALELGVPAGDAWMRQADIAARFPANEQPGAMQIHAAPAAAGVHDFQIIHGRTPLV
jgi:hypothetical protein